MRLGPRAHGDIECFSFECSSKVFLLNVQNVLRTPYNIKLLYDFSNSKLHKKREVAPEADI